jgi:hypothetical protein
VAMDDKALGTTNSRIAPELGGAVLRRARLYTLERLVETARVDFPAGWVNEIGRPLEAIARFLSLFGRFCRQPGISIWR